MQSDPVPTPKCLAFGKAITSMTVWAPEDAPAPAPAPAEDDFIDWSQYQVWDHSKPKTLPVDDSLYDALRQRWDMEEVTRRCPEGYFVQRFKAPLKRVMSDGVCHFKPPKGKIVYVNSSILQILQGIEDMSTACVSP